MAFGITTLAFIILYFTFSFLNPNARDVIQKIALIQYRENGVIKYKLIHSNKMILKELIYTQNINHVKIPVEKYDALYFFNRNYVLNVFDGNYVRLAKDHVKKDLLENVKSSTFNIYNNYAVKRFVSFVRGDYEKDLQ